MNWLKALLQIPTQGKGLYPFTRQVSEKLHAWSVQEGMLYLFVQHTSASLVISENYDPSAKVDLEAFMERLVPEGQSWYRHTMEGPDDSPSHMRAMLTAPHLVIPIDGGELSLGTWQGIYLFEHRKEPQRRKVLLRCLQVS